MRLHTLWASRLGMLGIAMSSGLRGVATVASRAGLAALAGVACVALAGCEDTVTEENYANLTPGLSLAQVEKIMGGAGGRVEQGGMSTSAAGMAGGSGANSQVTYSWKSGSREITATFQGEKLVNTGKAGL